MRLVGGTAACVRCSPLSATMWRTWNRSKRYQPSEPQVWVGAGMTDLSDAPVF